MKQVIFTLTSARSGTLYLRNLFRNNIPHCDCRHEPFFDWGNPTLLGPAIYDAYAGRLDNLRALLSRKRDYINRLKGKTYLESSHAFLKSAYLVALEFFPQLELIHLIRDPLKVAKSEAYREAWRRRVHAPFHYYTGDDGRRHFFWSLTTNEPIFQVFGSRPLTLFQRYLLQWIEIENRAIAFLQANRLAGRCFRLSAPDQLNDPFVLRAMFRFLGLQPAGFDLLPGGRKNKSLGATTTISEEDRGEAAAVLRQLPGSYLEIFRHPPYVNQAWNHRFLALARGTPPAQFAAISATAAGGTSSTSPRFDSGTRSGVNVGGQSPF